MREAFSTAHENQWFEKIEKKYSIKNLVETLFGSEGQGIENQGMLQLSSATLSSDEKAFFNHKDNSTATVNSKAHLYRIIQSTKIDTITGVATKGSLRSMEVTVPMTLKSELELNTYHTAYSPELAQEILPLLNACCGLILELGGKRHRGFGQVSVLAEKNNHQPVA